MRIYDNKLIIPRLNRLAHVAYILATAALISFFLIVLYEGINKGSEASSYFSVAGIVLSLWMLLTVIFAKNYRYLHIKYGCTTEGIFNRINGEHKILLVTTGVFCTCVHGKFYMRYGCIYEEFYLFSIEPIDQTSEMYAGINLIKKIWGKQIWIMPVCLTSTAWIRENYGCERVAQYPKVTYFPPRDKGQGQAGQGDGLREP